MELDLSDASIDLEYYQENDSSKSLSELLLTKKCYEYSMSDNSKE